MPDVCHGYSTRIHRRGSTEFDSPSVRKGCHETRIRFHGARARRRGDIRDSRRRVRRPLRHVPKCPAVGGTLYPHASSGARKGARTSISGSIFRVYANTYDGADGGLYATSDSVSSIVVLSHPGCSVGRSGCEWTLAGSHAHVDLKCESRIAS
ncbi:hypothetical protein GCM10009733_056140 [Nonomuraea maheshkhaliensis]|uniref:Uncharacterized protein n=1 Tax=Nonomuraea maheshkhaliensis TaxID=419590 RepID=A0ABN2FL54_9ACTN